MKITENDVGRIIVSVVGYKRKILGVCGLLVFLSHYDNLGEYGGAYTQSNIRGYKWEEDYKGKILSRDLENK